MPDDGVRRPCPAAMALKNFLVAPLRMDSKIWKDVHAAITLCADELTLMVNGFPIEGSQQIMLSAMLRLLFPNKFKFQLADAQKNALYCSLRRMAAEIDPKRRGCEMAYVQLIGNQSLSRADAMKEYADVKRGFARKGSGIFLGEPDTNVVRYLKLLGYTEMMCFEMLQDDYRSALATAETIEHLYREIVARDASACEILDCDLMMLSTGIIKYFLGRYRDAIEDIGSAVDLNYAERAKADLYLRLSSEKLAAEEALLQNEESRAQKKPRKNKRRNKRRGSQEPPPESEDETDAQQAIIDSVVGMVLDDGGPDAAKNECVICMDGAKTHAVIPCGHVCVCESCSARVSNKCPVCMQDASGVLKLYHI